MVKKCWRGDEKVEYCRDSLGGGHAKGADVKLKGGCCLRVEM